MTKSCFLLYIGLLLFSMSCQSPDQIRVPSQVGSVENIESIQAAKGDSAGLKASDLIVPLGTGVWTNEDDEDQIYAWVDARVSNFRYNKRIFIEVLATYLDGREVRTIHPAQYRGELDRDERWGTDSIEVYLYHGDKDNTLSSMPSFRLRVQAYDPEVQTEKMLMTDWQALYEDETLAFSHEITSEMSLHDDWSKPLLSPVNTNLMELDPQVLFSPYDDPGSRIITELDRLAQKKLDRPETRVTFHAAVFNMNDPEINDAVIRAYQAGVEVRLLMDGRKFRVSYDWYNGDDHLLNAGIPLLGIKYSGRGAMHNKFMLFDGEILMTGSMNWEYGGRYHNHENMVIYQHHDLISAYAARFEAIAGWVKQERSSAFDLQDNLSVSFAPDEPSHKILGHLIDQARHQILVAMFTAKDVRWNESGEETSLFEKLISAKDRGVNVQLVIDHGIHEANEYYGVLSEDDPIDEWLEEQGIHVVRADNLRSRYASMHHKFMVVDQEITVTGAYNWYYDSAFLNDEDQIVIRSPKTAAVYCGEFVNLLAEYDDRFEPQAWPTRQVKFELYYPHSEWGDRLVISGSIPELGEWALENALALNGREWPYWQVQLDLPIGIRGEYKVALIRRNEEVLWDNIFNRNLYIDPSQSEVIHSIEPYFIK